MKGSRVKIGPESEKRGQDKAQVRGKGLDIELLCELGHEDTCCAASVSRRDSGERSDFSGTKMQQKKAL